MFPGFAPLLPSPVNPPIMTLTAASSSSSDATSTYKSIGFIEGVLGALASRQLTSNVRVSRLTRDTTTNDSTNTVTDDLTELHIIGPTDAILTAFLDTFPWFKQHSPVDRASISSKTNGTFEPAPNSERRYRITVNTSSAGFSIDNNGTYQYRRTA